MTLLLLEGRSNWIFFFFFLLIIDPSRRRRRRGGGGRACSGFAALERLSLIIWRSLSTKPAYRTGNNFHLLQSSIKISNKIIINKLTFRIEIRQWSSFPWGTARGTVRWCLLHLHLLSNNFLIAGWANHRKCRLVDRFSIVQKMAPFLICKILIHFVNLHFVNK